MTTIRKTRLGQGPITYSVQDPGLRADAQERMTRKHMARLRFHAGHGGGLRGSPEQRDGIDLDLFAAGYIAHPEADLIRNDVFITPEGREALARFRISVADSRGGHESLVERIYSGPAREGSRMAFKAIALDLEAPVTIKGKQQTKAMPDVLSILATSNERKWDPITYEIKNSRSDALADINAGKWQCYLPFSSRIIFVTHTGNLDPGEVPDPCGLLIAGELGFEWAKKPKVNRDWELSAKQVMKLLWSLAEPFEN